MVSASIDSSSVVRMKSVSHEYRFEVDYFKVRYLPSKTYVASPTLDCGGYEWAIQYYPQYKAENDQFICLALLSKAKDVSAEFNFVISNKGETYGLTLSNLSYMFSRSGTKYGNIVNKSVVENYAGTVGIFIITFKIKVLSERINKVNASSDGLQEHMGKLLERCENFDVTFEVEGNKVSAHRLILAARSPVFKAELFGSMAEADMTSIRIDDMKADVFKAMLSFMYTDKISCAESLKFSEMSIEFLHDLFVAADRYSLEKLKEICQEILCNRLSVKMVSSTLVLADRHSCPLLKETCLEFASKPENFMQLALTEEYHHMIQAAPSLLVELREKVNYLSGVGTKKQRIV